MRGMRAIYVSFSLTIIRSNVVMHSCLHMISYIIILYIIYIGNSWLWIEDVSRPRQIFARSQYVGALNNIADTYLNPDIFNILRIYQCIWLFILYIYYYYMYVYVNVYIYTHMIYINIICDSLGYAGKIK